MFYDSTLGLERSFVQLICLFPLGIYELTHDNKTEHLRTINILHRFNIHQEVILGVLYKILPIQVSCSLCIQIIRLVSHQ